VDLKLNRTRVIDAMDKLRDKKDLDLSFRSWIEGGLKDLKDPNKQKK